MGPVALRYPRGEAEGVALPDQPEILEVGRGELLREGSRVALLGYGYGVPVALGAAGLLEDEHGIEATVADARFAKPLDGELIARLVDEHEVLVTVEENVLAGGFGSAVLEHLADHDLLGSTRVLRFGLPDRYVTHGKPALLREEVGLTPEAVAGRVAEAVLRAQRLRSRLSHQPPLTPRARATSAREPGRRRGGGSLPSPRTRCAGRARCCAAWSLRGTRAWTPGRSAPGRGPAVRSPCHAPATRGRRPGTAGQ